MKAGFETGAAPAAGKPTRGQNWEPAPLPEIARLFPQLQIVELLGFGGMGAVYKARQPVLDRWVALKILPPQATARAGFAERFSREARALARLNHPGIVAVHEFGEVGGTPYFLMEYVEGLTLRQLVAQGRLSPRQALQIVPQICEALQYAHDEGVVHRDIKPENILLDNKGRVKIADFGIAKILGKETGPANATAGAQVVGTPHYMAPEQIEHPQAVDHRADIYSLGVVFYELLTGELPLGKFALPSQKAAVDLRLDEVVLHALEKEPAQRYQQARQVKTDVEAIASESSPLTPSASEVAGVAAARHGPRLLTARAKWALAVAAVVAPVLVWMLGSALIAWRRDRGGLGAGRAASAGGIVFPLDAGVVDVTKPPYEARGNGKTDDTEAIQRALDDHPNQQAIIYLPDGIYLISHTLRWGHGSGAWAMCKRTTLQGQSREGTILKLKDACPGYEKPATPQAVLWTGPSPAERYRNAVRNLTVDTGVNNPGAIGVQFNANYIGCARDVLIRSGDGQGITGLDLAFTGEIGPLLVKNVTVRGFDVGVRAGQGYGLTFEHLRLEHQRQCAFFNDAQSVAIHDLVTVGRGTAFLNSGSVGLAVIVDAKLEGIEDAQAAAAITNRSGLFVRNLSVSGFAHAISSRGPGGLTNEAGPFVSEWSSRLWPGSRASLNLPVKETPEVPWDPPGEWANPVDFGASPLGQADASEAIQQAIDSGKSTVYLPRGDYAVRKPIVLRGKVRRFIGCEASLRVSSSIPAEAALTVAEGDSPVVVVERIAGGFDQPRWHPRFITNPSQRTLVLCDCLGIEAEFTGPGEVFLENVDGRFDIRGAKVWARQVNAGTSGDTPPNRWWHLRNEGGALWALGIRTGGPGPVVTTTGGGRSEVLGGLMYSFATGSVRAQPEPAFVLGEGALSVSIIEMTHAPGVFYSVLVSRATTNGQASDLLSAPMAPGGINGSLIPFFAAEGK
jgi:hypothetical protein